VRPGPAYRSDRRVGKLPRGGPWAVSAASRSGGGTMNRAADVALALLRLAAGVIFICAGGMKLFHWFGGMPAGVELTPRLVTAGVIEVFGGALITLGLFARPAAFIASGEMAFAYFIGHYPNGFWPIQNHGEPA